MLGSPPRMRGKHSNEVVDVERLRITPADAGKTGNTDFFGRYSWDHPRGCGENKTQTAKYYFTIGSPPQVRGKLTRSMHAGKSVGITPAGAGKTLIR